MSESVTIEASPETVWFFLDDPELVKSWNPKLTGWEPISQGARSQGYTFRVQYSMKGKQTWWDAKFSEYQPHTRLVWAMSDPNKPTTHNAQLIYELKAKGNATRLKQVVEFSDAMIPWPIRLLVKFIFHFGRAQNERYLHTLKRLAENV